MKQENIRETHIRETHSERNVEDEENKYSIISLKFIRSKYYRYHL